MKTNNVLNGTKKVKNKNQETDGYGRDKRPKTEKTEGNNDNWKLEKTETENYRPNATQYCLVSSGLMAGAARG